MILNRNTLENKDLLVVCPSRGRPKELWRMYESFIKTISAKTGLVICLDNDDPNDYNDFGCAISIEPRKTITRIYNDIFNKFQNFKYYSCTNDDFVYKTLGWDYKLMGQGINFGSDLNHDFFPTTSVIDGDIVRALGWLQMPKLNHLYGDSVWQTIGKEAGCLNFNKDVVIEHHHYLFGKSDIKTYENVINQAFISRDRMEYVKWLAVKSNSDIQKVKRLYDFDNRLGSTP